MRNFKKVVAAGLALLMLALSVNVSFAAENYTDKETVVVAKVNAAGIMTGTDKGFEPSKTLTRAEAAAIMVRMKGISEDTVKQNAGTTLFTDVAASHWAAGYVNVASNYEIIKGVGAGKFAPEKEVTVAEFYTMAIRALNAGQLVEAEGTWPTNYVNFAIENDLAEDVAQLYTAAATRMTAATIVANTLEANMWKKFSVVTNGEITWVEDENKNILEDVLKIKVKENVEFKSTDSKENTAVIKNYTGMPEDVNKDFLVSQIKLGFKYTVWYNDDEILGAWVPVNNERIEFTDIKDVDGDTVTLIVDGKEKEYKLSAVISGATKNTVAYKNNRATAWEVAERAEDAMPIFGTAYLNESGKYLEFLYAEQFEDYAVVKEVTDKRIVIESEDKVVGTTDDDDITINLKDDSKVDYKVTKNGKAIDIKDIEDGDVLFFYTYAPKENYTTYVIDVVNDTVEGKISSASASASKVTIDGTSYKVLGLTVGNSGDIKAGSKGTFYLNNEGKIVMFKESEKDYGNYAVVAGIKYTTDTTDGGSSVTAYVKLITMDGETTDWLEVDKKETEKTENMGTGFVSTDENKLLKAADDHYTFLKTVVRYEMKSGKVVLQNIDTSKDKKTGLTFVGTNTEDYVKDSANKPYYLNDSTVVIEIKADKDTDHKLSKELLTAKVIDVDDLDSAAVLGIFALSKNDEPGYVVIENSNIKAEQEWAFVLAKRDSDDDENDDIKFEYDVLYEGKGEDDIVTIKSEKSFDVVGKLCELTVEDDLLTDAVENAVESAEAPTENRLFKKYSGRYTFINATEDDGEIDSLGAESIRWTIASDCLVIALNEDSEYEVSTIESIDALNAKAKQGDAWDDTTDLITKVYVDKIDPAEADLEIVGIVYTICK